MAAPLSSTPVALAADVPPATTPVPVPPPPDAEAATHKANILIVDDREDKRMAMETVIADLGQNIYQAPSGRDALRLLLAHEFAVILLDVNMPGMDGFETAHMIRQRKSLENVPIIFVSAISDAETHVSRGYSLGAVDYILAPIVPEILRAKVAVFVELFKITDQVKRQAEALRQAQGELEKRVQQRTRELAVANESLRIEVEERQRAEQELRNLNGELEQRVAIRTSELQAANRELETFTYSVAHDLRAPFRQIHGYAEILQQEFSSAMDAEAQRYLSRIAVKSGEMERMVDDLLNLFTVNSRPFERRETDLRDLIHEVVHNLKGEFGDRRIVWKIGDIPPLYCNAALMKQVFENLFSNAVKYSRPREEAMIEVGCFLRDEEQVVFVKDSGVGFDMENVSRLFGVFQRLHRAEEFEGSGVGLALVQRIIQRHGGHIWAEGKVGLGATFYFTLGEDSRE